MNNRDYINYLKGFKIKTCKTIKDSPEWLAYRIARNRKIKEIIKRLNILNEIMKIAKPEMGEKKVLTTRKRLDILENICSALEAVKERR